MKRMSVALAVVGMLMVAASAFAQAPAAPALSAEQVAQSPEDPGRAHRGDGKAQDRDVGEAGGVAGPVPRAESGPDQDRGEAEGTRQACKAQMVEKEHAYRLSMAEVLTPEQRAQLPAFGGRMPFGGPRGGKGGMGFRW
ncbi:MAG: hypothetical protein MZV70_30215 [Desulfobacterales bacterium]|nr:hypothetical protein [Desulfobacterales bacterium]